MNINGHFGRPDLLDVGGGATEHRYDPTRYADRSAESHVQSRVPPEVPGNGLATAQGLLFGVLISVPFWAVIGLAIYLLR